MKDIKIEIKKRKITHNVTPSFFHRSDKIIENVYDVFVYIDGDLKHEKLSLESVEAAGESALAFETFYKYFKD